jgi:dTDP-4-amino-4,6-dideoxygalactose transaminase
VSAGEGKVPFVALDRDHGEIREELRAAFERVVDASAFMLGAEVDAFEDEFARYCGARHCVGVSSGTAALSLALAAAQIGPGDEVVVPAHTFIASALGVLHAGATPVLCDVEPGTGLISAESALAAIGPRTKAIMAVHLYGQACDMDSLRELATSHGLVLIEDAAQAHGSEWRGRRAGTLGDIAAFSFYPSKNLGALGDAGAVCSGDADLAERVRMLRDLGQRRKGEHIEPGWNERLDGLQAALLRVKLGRLDSANAVRRRRAAEYRELLGGAVELLEERRESPCTFHLFPIRAPDRDRLASMLAERGIGTGVHYSPALQDQPALLGKARARVPLDAAERWAATELSLPMFGRLRADEVARVAGACLESLALDATR